MAIGNFGNWLYDFIDSLKDVLHQISLFKEKEVGLKTETWILKNDSNIDEYKGLLTPDKILLYVPDAGRLHIKPRIYRKGNKQYVFIGEGQHNGNEDQIIKLSKTVKHDALIKWKHMRKWVTTKVTNLESTIDFNILDNDFSPQFASHSFLVIQTKVLHFLKEQTNIKLILMIISAFLLGGIIGFLSAMLLYVIILLFM